MQLKPSILFHLLLLNVFLLAYCLSGCSVSRKGQATVSLKQDGHSIQIENGRVKLQLNIDSSMVTQTYYARAGREWKQVAAAFSGNENTGAPVMPLYKRGEGVAKEYRLMTNEGLHAVRVLENNADRVRLLLNGHINANDIEQSIELSRDQDYFHVEINATLTKEPRLEYLLSSFVFALPGEPDFTFVPSVKRSDDDVIGDRKFFAPAALVEKDGYMLALVPDLNLINAGIVYAEGARPQKHPRIFAVPIDTTKASLPTALDLNLKAGVTPLPLISYGFMDYWVEQHLYWRHDNADGKQVRKLSGNKLRYGFDLFIKGGVKKYYGYQGLSSFLWKKYGSVNFRLPRPQAMPYSDYAKFCYPASFDYQGYDVVKGPDIKQRSGQPELATWQQWESNGIAMGGLRLSAPQWNHFLYNTPWWNNVGDATGIFFWGREVNDSSLTDKAKRIISFTLSAPQQEGIFPTLYDVNKKSWVKSLWNPPMENYNPDSVSSYWEVKGGDGAYQTAATSVTAGFLLQYMNTCENNPGILPFVQRYGDFLVRNLPADGCVPGWFSKDLKPLPSLKWNADGGAHMWVLAELYKLTRDQKYLHAAKKIADFMIREVLPRQKWYDFETFYSCAVKPESFFDPRTGQYPANNMSVSWALEGFASLYDITHDAADLEAAGAIADYSLFYQAVWAPHYIITAYPFGGFSSQNSDAEWLDQRSHRFASGLVRVGILSGRQDLLERGVAAARASLTLVNHPLHISNDIYRFPNYPPGLGPENIDHEGFPQTPLRSGPSWAEVGGLAAAAHILYRLGGAYVNFRENIALGVDGVTVTNHSLKNDTITLRLQSLLSGLKIPFKDPFSIHLHLTGLEKRKYTLMLNDNQPVALEAGQAENFPVTVYPGGEVKPVN